MVNLEKFYIYEISDYFSTQKILKVTGKTEDETIKFSVYFRYHPERTEVVSYYLGQEFPAEMTFLDGKTVSSKQLIGIYHTIYEAIYLLINNGYPIIIQDEHIPLHA